MPGSEPIIIAGGGIAGLSAAIALAHKGFEITIFEQASVLSDQGAGIQLGPNATSILQHWGLKTELAHYACQPAMIELHCGERGKKLARLPVGRFVRDHWPAPYLTIHRGDLQNLLQQAIEKNPRIHIHCSARVQSVSGTLERNFDVIAATPAGEEKHCASLLIACDGVWSQLRSKEIAEGKQAQFSGYIAWRANLLRESLQEFAPDLLSHGQNIQVFMGRTGHFITYPIRQGQEINLVAITRSEGDETGDKTALSRKFRHWQPDIDRLVSHHIETWTYWPLFHMPVPCFLSPSGMVFLGDSAHALTPFTAQGAAMAIEDACRLARYLPKGNISKSRHLLQSFADERYRRIARVSRRGTFNRLVYHAGGGVALARNLLMQNRAGEKFLKDLDWLYHYHAFD